MNGVTGFRPAELRALRSAIDGFAARTRSNGRDYFWDGQVLDLRPISATGSGQPLVGFEADVSGTALYTVTWLRDSGDGWDCLCTCPVEFECKHAYAAALKLLESGEQMATAGAGDSGRSVLSKSAGRMLPAPAESRGLTALLEEKHGRPLKPAERSFVRKLERLWQNHRTYGTIYTWELADVSLADRAAGLYYDPNPAIKDWWEKPLNSPLDLWQYLAFFAERANRPLPPLMKPVTDTSKIGAEIDALQRRRLVEEWERVFREPLPPAVVPTAPTATIPEVRLRLAKPKLIWEYRAAPEAPWRAAKGGIVTQWFDAIARNPAGAPTSALAILQEAQLRRTRDRLGYGWSSGTKPQTLNVQDVTTTDFVRWMLANESLRNSFVNEAGETYDSGVVALIWTARISPSRPEDIEFTVTMPDGDPLPRGMFQLNGLPPLGLHGRTIFQFPPPLSEGSDSTVHQVPREALTSVAAARHLKRIGVVVESGLDLPVVETVPLVPRFVCRLVEEWGRADLNLSSRLDVELHGRSADGRADQCWNGRSWIPVPGHGVSALPRQSNKVWDLDTGPADAAKPFLDALRLTWGGTERGWTRPVTRNFPDEFAEWAASVAVAGIDLECDPLLAGLARPPDRARVEMEIAAPDEGGSGIDWFDLKLVVRAEDATLTDTEIALLLKARGRFVLLKGKGWRRMELELDPQQTERLAELGLDPGALDPSAGEHRQRFHALQLADERIAGLLPEEHAERARQRVATMRAIEPPALPANLTGELRPYQQEGFHFLVHLSTNSLGGVLADDMGLGKTVQALAWLLWLADQKPAGKPLRVLVVCPKSVVTNWALETRRFAPSLPVAEFGVRDAVLPKSGLVVINYAQLRRAADDLGKVVWDAVILDEGQNIKNPGSQTAQVARNLRAAHRLVLTGTPIENRALDLWSLFAFAMPGLLGGQTAFKRTFNDKTDPLACARLARRVRHFMLRRTKGQVAADLPPRIEEDLIVELEPRQLQLYQAELKRARQMLLDVETSREFNAQRFNILQSLLRLRQICCDPGLLGAGGTSDSAKVAALFDQLEPILAEGHKVLVFSQFVSMIEILQKKLTQRNIPFLTITGKTEKRQELVDQFQTSPDISVFLLSLKAAGSGLNLTAASYVVLFDPWWNPAVEAQAIDRTHRIGQVNQVMAYRLIAKDTVEEKIRLLQREKAALARAVIQEESLATVMNLDDLRYVLG